MLTIWEYKLEMGESPKLIKMPFGAKILTIHIHKGDPHISALVDLAQGDVVRQIEMHTSESAIREIPDTKLEYIGILKFSVFFFHVFERINL